VTAADMPSRAASDLGRIRRIPRDARQGDVYRGLHHPTAAPRRVPTPKVSAAAARPSEVCRPPEIQTERPVNNVIAAPIANRTSPLTAMLAISATVPLANA